MKMRFTLRPDIINYRDINVLAFHSGQHINYIINVYSNDNQNALQVLNCNIIDLNDTVVMTGDFNIRDNDWDPNYPYHSIHTKDLFTLAESLGLDLSPSLNPGPTRFADNLLVGIKRFDHETKVKARSERRNLQTASQLCTKQVGTGEMKRAY